VSLRVAFFRNKKKKEERGRREKKNLQKGEEGLWFFAFVSFVFFFATNKQKKKEKKRNTSNDHGSRNGVLLETCFNESGNLQLEVLETLEDLVKVLLLQLENHAWLVANDGARARFASDHAHFSKALTHFHESDASGHSCFVFLYQLHSSRLHTERKGKKKIHHHHQKINCCCLL
jgi:hypothetical protein